jgi:hypothetical protein
LPDQLSEKIQKQIRNAGLPTAGQVPFIPSLVKNKKGKTIIEKAAIRHGPKKGKLGYVDTQGRIWIKCHAHANVGDHWDVQEDGGATYFRVGENGNRIS